MHGFGWRSNQTNASRMKNQKSRKYTKKNSVKFAHVADEFYRDSKQSLPGLILSSKGTESKVKNDHIKKKYSPASPRDAFEANEKWMQHYREFNCWILLCLMELQERIETTSYDLQLWYGPLKNRNCAR